MHHRGTCDFALVCLKNRLLDISWRKSSSWITRSYEFERLESLLKHLTGIWCPEGQQNLWNGRTSWGFAEGLSAGLKDVLMKHWTILESLRRVHFKLLLSQTEKLLIWTAERSDSGRNHIRSSQNPARMSSTWLRIQIPEVTDILREFIFCLGPAFWSQENKKMT